ncbi:MAG TPA: ATP-binding protein [Ohtaekwangia sp.]|nr:ATP-binding protein [Ohtaekwangia sp.]
MKKLFDKLFPFHLIFDHQLRIVQIGKSAAKLLPSMVLETPVTDHFVFIQPFATPSFDAIKANEDSIFLLQSVKDPIIDVKGQMTFLEEQHRVLFVFTPVFDKIEYLGKIGISAADFPVYDNTMELRHALRQAQDALTAAETLTRTFEEKVTERTFELKQKNDEMLAQHEEYIQQQEMLNNQSHFLAEKNRKLQRARELIHSKNRELKKRSINLEAEVRQRTHDLMVINKELLEQNNQLEQFAFMVAHNLRAPIARILGLINLMKLESLVTPPVEFYIDSIDIATQRLEEVIKDLNTILEIRKGLSHAYVQISFSEKINKVKETLAVQIQESGVTITTDFSVADNVYSISSYVENILYNLLSNSIKYRHAERPLKIHVFTCREGDDLCLIVRDNGIGFDMEQNRDNLFKLYKRFHDHVEGKGLGLYMIKTQVQALGGKVEAESTLDEGALFKIFFPGSSVPAIK